MKHQKLKDLRQRYNIGQEEMADAMFTNVTYYRKKENGVSNFTLNEAFMLSTIFGEPIEELFQFTYKNIWGEGDNFAKEEITERIFKGEIV